MIDDDESEDIEQEYLRKSSAAGRMGKAAEYLVAAVCILATRGELNVSTSIVDDKGVDLVFHRRNSTATLAVQVKARMTDSKLAGRGRFRANVRSQTFQPRSDLDMLFILVNPEDGIIPTAWLVPSQQFDEKHGRATSRGAFRFAASIRSGSTDKWSRYRVVGTDLPAKILQRLEELRPAYRVRSSFLD